jgi:LacI family transcriptional regulator
VGRDLSISGFDDIPVAAVSNPALTTARMPVREMVAAGVGMAIGEGGTTLDGAPTHPVLQPELVIRESTGPVPD